MTREADRVDFAIAPEVEEATGDCSHETAKLVGVDAGNNRYERCVDCEAVIVVGGSAHPTPTARRPG